MRIGLIGGTGKEGRGLSARWARAGHDVFIGSRDAQRGRDKAAELSAKWDVTMQGGGNDEAATFGEVVVLCVPWSAHEAAVTGIAPHVQGKLVVDITVPLQPPKVRKVHLPDGGSAVAQTARILGDGVRVVGTLHHVSSAHLADPDHTIDCDVLVCGNGRSARDEVIALIGDLGLRGVDAGVLANAVALESLTPVLLHINRRYKAGGAGLRITGLD